MEEERRPTNPNCEPYGKCRKRGWCSTCNNCRSSHCSCRLEPRVQFARSNRAVTVEKIRETALNITPHKVREVAAPATPPTQEKRPQWKRFLEMVADDDDIRIGENFVATPTMSESSWKRLDQFCMRILYQFGSAAVAENSDEADEIVEILLNRMAKRLKKQPNKYRSTLQEKIESFPLELIKLLQVQSSGDVEYKTIRALLVSHFSSADIAKIQPDSSDDDESNDGRGGNCSDHESCDEDGSTTSSSDGDQKQAAHKLHFGKKARRTAIQDFKCLEARSSNITPNGVHRMLSRVSDEIVHAAVDFIFDNCKILSWGTRNVPSGNKDGDLVAIPAMTRCCSPTDMWEMYEKKYKGTLQKFNSILRHEEVSDSSKEYKGSRFNLLIKWEGDEPTWEPLAAVIKDDAVSCALYGKSHSLLDREGWKGLSKIFDVSTGKPVRQPTNLASKGKQQFVGRTTFLSIVRAITAGGEKLVTSVDYVRGTLILDTVNTMQRIIDDHLIDHKEKHKAMTKHLTVVSNFAKNQYKLHTVKTDDVDTHGLQFGLCLPPEELNKEPHYSCMKSEQLDLLLQARGLVPKGMSLAAKRRVLDDDDFAGREDESEEKKEDESDQEVGSTEGFEFIFDHTGMSMSDLRSLIKERDIRNADGHLVSARSKPQLVERLQSWWHSRKDDERLAANMRALRIDGDECSPEPDVDDTDSNEICDDSSAQENDEESTQTGVDQDQAEQCASCQACTYLHYFFLKLLPDSLQSVRCNQNADSIDDALAYISDAHNKFKLYQAHCVRVINQQQALSSNDKRLHLECQQGDHRQPHKLNVIIDFKMKWEAMYAREKTVENYGKRGISWHGARIEFYVVDDNTGEVIKRAVKVDQILKERNKQDGMTVLALVEALLTYIKDEFPGADIEYLQSDNAGCYHLKELLVGIPLLNAKMRQLGGPLIRRVIHTETQDGKSLLDAHFAHATALIKRYLRRGSRNLLKKVTSADELADGLSDRGGLRMCGVQLVAFDEKADSALSSLGEELSLCGEKLKEYFSRANEIEYLLDEDSADGKKFSIRVSAYSNIGSGATFEVNLDEGSVSVVGESDGVMEDIGGVDEHAANDASGIEVLADNIEQFETEESNEEADVITELLEEVIDEQEVGVEGYGLTAKKLLSVNHLRQYDVSGMVTSVKVEKILPLGDILEVGKAKKTSVVNKPNLKLTDNFERGNGGRSAVFVAIRRVATESIGQYDIKDGLDDDRSEYACAENFVVPLDHVQDPGWARRAQRGEMYGQKYIAAYKDRLLELFRRGSEDSERKMGPNIMLEVLMKENPRKYRLPNFTEIQGFVNQLTSKEKQRKELTSLVPSRSKNAYSLLDDEHRRTIREIVEGYGGQILPESIVFRTKKRFPSSFLWNHTDFKKQVKGFGTKVRRDWISQRNRNLIG